MSKIEEKLKISERGQVMPVKVEHFGSEAFGNIDCTEIRWLGSASMMINSRGTNLMIDPLLQDFDMPLLFEIPILPGDVPSLDAVLVTHIDNDHFSRSTCRGIPVCWRNIWPCPISQM